MSDDIVTRLRTAASNNRAQAEHGTDTSGAALSFAQKAGKRATAETHDEAANEIERLRRPFRNADKLDWMRLFDLLGDGGYGKFWKEVLREARDALRVNI